MRFLVCGLIVLQLSSGALAQPGEGRGGELALPGGMTLPTFEPKPLPGQVKSLPGGSEGVATPGADDEAGTLAGIIQKNKDWGAHIGGDTGTGGGKTPDIGSGTGNPIDAALKIDKCVQAYVTLGLTRDKAKEFCAPK